MELEKQTVDADALLTRVEQLLDQGRPGAARPLLAAARGLAQPSSGLSVLAARLALSDGVFNNSEQELDRAVSADPDHTGLRKCRAELRCRLGDLDGAARDAAEAVILAPDDPAAKALLGEMLLRLGCVVDAAACLHEAVAAAPGNIAYRETLAQAQTASGHMDSAMATLLEGVRIVPRATAIRNAAILLCIRRRDFVHAESLAEQARTDGVSDATTFGLKGHALASLGRQEEAGLAYNEAWKLAPGNAQLRHLATAGGIISTAPRAPDEYVRTLFDGFADRFERHLIELGYRVPGLIRAT